MVRFRATGLSFPAAGCWEVTAAAAERELSFVVWVEPLRVWHNTLPRLKTDPSTGRCL